MRKFMAPVRRRRSTIERNFPLWAINAPKELHDIRLAVMSASAASCRAEKLARRLLTDGGPGSGKVSRGPRAFDRLISLSRGASGADASESSERRPVIDPPPPVCS